MSSFGKSGWCSAGRAGVWREGVGAVLLPSPQHAAADHTDLVEALTLTLTLPVLLLNVISGKWVPVVHLLTVTECSLLEAEQAEVPPRCLGHKPPHKLAAARSGPGQSQELHLGLPCGWQVCCCLPGGP